MRTKEDRLIDRLEAPQIRQYAKSQRRNLGWERPDRVDPLSLETLTEIWTVRGVTPFSLKFVADEKLRGYYPGRTTYDACHTTYDGCSHIVTLPEGLRRKGFVGDGYARFVIAREFGHVTLRHPEMLKALRDKFCQQPEGGDARKVVVSGAGSVNFQAGVFAAALLIDDDMARGVSSLEELSVEAGIDQFSARYYFAEIAEAGAHLCNE